VGRKNDQWFGSKSLSMYWAFCRVTSEIKPARRAGHKGDTSIWILIVMVNQYRNGVMSMVDGRDQLCDRNCQAVHLEERTIR
jgi:hypothetical protein